MNTRSRNGVAGLGTVLWQLLRAMRPVQWVKNVFVLAPLVFGLKLNHGPSVVMALITFVLFSLVSSAVYLLNDLNDRELDARHPTKRFRPIASGQLPLEAARLGVVALFLTAMVGGLLFDYRVALVLGGYFVLNVAYTGQLKHYAFVDITCIALGFLLRVLAGGVAVHVTVSAWLLVCTFLLASLLALGKRRHELMVVLRQGAKPGTRKVLERYRTTHIDWVMRVSAVVTVLSYTAYAFSSQTARHFGTDALMWTVPFVIYGLFRYAQLVVRHADAQSPTDTMVRDLPFLLNVGAWGFFVTVAIYFQW